jgi:secondary thiamine-phosphate synthase enzyme
MSVTWHQAEVRLEPRARGFHLITGAVVAALPELARVRIGWLHLFLQHTSASISINENADPDVRADMEAWLDRAVPDAAPYFVHTAEGPDDMSAHLKAALLGCSLTIPVRRGRLALGTWQGIYLGEHRDAGGPRTLIATLSGELGAPSAGP